MLCDDIVLGAYLYFPQVTIDGVGETVVVGMKFLSGELSPNTVYTYRILAINGHGDGEVSPDMTFTTSFGGMKLPVIDVQ